MSSPERDADKDPANPETLGTASDVLAEINRSMLQMFAFHFGRAPETIKTGYSDADTIVSIVGNSLTPVEIMLRDAGERQRLREIRMAFQHASEGEYRAIIEEITGTKVIGFLSGTDIDNDLSSEVFTLGPSVRAR